MGSLTSWNTPSDLHVPERRQVWAPLRECNTQDRCPLRGPLHLAGKWSTPRRARPCRSDHGQSIDQLSSNSVFPNHYSSVSEFHLTCVMFFSSSCRQTAFISQASWHLPPNLINERMHLISQLGVMWENVSVIAAVSQLCNAIGVVAAAEVMAVIPRSPLPPPFRHLYTTSLSSAVGI